MSVEEVAHEAPCPSRVLGWLLGRERGCCDTKETTPRRSCVCAQGQGLFYHKFQPRQYQYPVLCINPQLGLFAPRICARDRARLQSVTCAHAPEHQVPMV